MIGNHEASWPEDGWEEEDEIDVQLEVGLDAGLPTKFWAHFSNNYINELSSIVWHKLPCCEVGVGAAPSRTLFSWNPKEKIVSVLTYYKYLPITLYKFWRIFLYLTDDAIARLYVT